jgi:probable F420-dependent oxidoreductase
VVQQKSREAGQRLLARMGKVGVWAREWDAMSSRQAAETIQALEALGVRSVWIAEGTNSKEAFAHAATLLAASREVVVATGIASIWARDAVAMAGGARTLAEAYPDRFLLGMGVSHAAAVARRGHVYGKPLVEMTKYLDAMDKAAFAGPPLDYVPPRVLAALRPRMLALAAERALGVHSYFVPVRHTRSARESFGPGPLIFVEQAVVLEPDAARARSIARTHTSFYLDRENYRNNILNLGFVAADTANGGSDRLVDALVAWGGVEQIVARIDEHLDAGADHVALQVIAPSQEFPLHTWRELSTALRRWLTPC